MNCPSCSTALNPTERQGIEIDHCPKCRGVWLDRGELDKLIERSMVYYTPPGSDQRRERSMDDSDYGRESHRHPKKRESFLSRMFDWD